MRDGTDKRPAQEVEDDDVICADAVEAIVWAEPQATGPREADSAIGREHPNEPARWFVLPDAHDRITRTERRLARDHYVVVRREDEVERAQLDVVDEMGRAQPPRLVEHGDSVLALAGGSYPRR